MLHACIPAPCKAEPAWSRRIVSIVVALPKAAHANFMRSINTGAQHVTLHDLSVKALQTKPGAKANTCFCASGWLGKVQ